MNISSEIESILFVAGKPLSFRRIAKAIGMPEESVGQALQELIYAYNRPDSGIHILMEGDEVTMATNPENTSSVEQFVKQEAAGELTRAQLETLTVIAYRGPMTRPEIEQIRGVNCAIILRNLLLRGLITEEDDKELLPIYRLSFEALSGLGLRTASELPDYQTLREHPHITQALEKKEEEPV